MRNRNGGLLFQAVGLTLALGILLAFSTRACAAENYTPGLYVNSATGDQFIVSGATESTGRTVWTLVGVENNGVYMNAIWETGAATGNSILAGDSNVISYPSGYGAGRSYGVLYQNVDWFGVIAASGTGTTITIADLNADGTTSQQFTLTLTGQGGTATASSEQFVSGIYRDYHGYGYLVSGAPAQSGQTMWTIVSMPDNPDRFEAIWETGPIADNIVFLDTTDVANYPAGYEAGRSYGRLGTNSFGWNTQSLALVQAGNTISISGLNKDGSTANQLVIVKDNSATTSYGAGTEDFSPGYYQDQFGHTYLVSGSKESTGRSVWTLASVDMPTQLNAVWETGAAKGNSVLAGSSQITSDPASFGAGRSYGIFGSGIFGTDGFLAAVQTGNAICITALNWPDVIVLTKESGSSGTIGSDSESYLAGSYMDVQGRTFTVSGSGNSWVITGTNGTDFNAQWETGPASSNTLLAGNSNVTTYPQGYLAGRSYGIIGTNNINWGGTIAAAQAGNTITLSAISNEGATLAQMVIIKGGAGGLGTAGDIGFAAAAYYDNVFGGKAIIAVNRTDGGSGMVTALYTTSAGTGAVNTDFTQTQGQLTWQNGDTSTQYIDVTIPKTAVGGVNFTIALSSPTGGAAIGNQGTATVTNFNSLLEIVAPVSLWQNATPLGNNWESLSWFGTFNIAYSPWIYHKQLGWLYPEGTDTNSIWFWDLNMNTFLWTNKTVFPWLYSIAENTWLYYVQGTTNPNWFYNYKEGKYEAH